MYVQVKTCNNIYIQACLQETKQTNTFRQKALGLQMCVWNFVSCCCWLWRVCAGSIYKREPFIQIRGTSVVCGVSVLVLYTKESLRSRLEVPLFCVACLYSLQIGGRSVVGGLSVLILYTKENLPSRLETSLLYVACLY